MCSVVSLNFVLNIPKFLFLISCIPIIFSFGIRIPIIFSCKYPVSPQPLMGPHKATFVASDKPFESTRQKTRQDKTNRQLAQKTNARKKLYKSQKPTNALSFNLETSVASSVSFNSRSLRKAVKIKAQLTFAEYLKRNSIVMFSWQ